MTKIKVLPVSDIPENTRKVIEVGEYKVLVIHSSGKFFAVDNLCPHMKLPLKNGKLPRMAASPALSTTPPLTLKAAM